MGCDRILAASCYNVRMISSIFARLPLRSSILAMALLGSLVAGSLIAAPAHAADADKKPKGETMAQAVLQVDGITSRVVDQVWENTDTYWHQGDYTRCVALIRLCVAIDPSFVEAYSTGSWLLWSMGDSSGADALLDDGARRSPVKGQIESEVGGQMFRTKRYQEAALHYGRAVQFGDTSALTYSAYAHTLEKVGRLNDAIKIWTRQVKEHPDFAAGPANLKRAIALRDSKAK